MSSRPKRSLRSSIAARRPFSASILSSHRATPSHSTAQVSPQTTSIKRPGFPLFDLPREIRDFIYEAALEFVPWGRRPEHEEALNWRPKAAALCLANRRCYEEANPILYANNTFHFANPVYFAFFVKRIGERNSSLICSISILIPSSGLPTPLALRSELKKYSHWAFALAQSRLKGLERIQVIAQHVGFTNDAAVHSALSPKLYGAILAAFQNTNKLDAPSVMLTGFGPKELARFPADWKVSGDSTPTRFYRVFHLTSRAHSTGRHGDEYYLFSRDWMFDNEGPYFTSPYGNAHFQIPVTHRLIVDDRTVLPRQAENMALRNLYRFHDLYWIESKGHSYHGITA
ncbi:MAG: hypothetical protein M1814_001098 [Vezdaea aestivalis]|nr:MAG: hypothetical protein M1814_001098 [Vezdaea aestivalis]